MPTHSFAATTAVPFPLLSSSAGSAGAGSGMATYTLCYEDDRRGLEKRVHFEAATPAVALEIAQGEAGGRWALLLCEGEVLCRLEREAVGLSEYWLITGDPARGAPAFPLQEPLAHSPAR